MNNEQKKHLKVLFINANDYLTLSGADLYTHKLIDVINHYYNADITEFSYDMCIYKILPTGIAAKNVNIIYPSKRRNHPDKKNWLYWALSNFYNTFWRAKRKIWEIVSGNNFDIIINGTMILYSDKRVMGLDNFISIQHQSYDFVLMKHYKIWQYIARVLTHLYGTRNCFKLSKNFMLYTEYDKQRVLECTKTPFDRKLFVCPIAKFKVEEIKNHWIAKQSVINSDEYEHDVIYVGRICKQQKRMHYFDYVAKHLNLNYGCVGDGVYCDQIKKNKSIKWHGILDKKIIAEKYINSKVSLLLSDYEGYGGSIVEAIACGTPVITTANFESHKYLKSKLGDAMQIISSKLKGDKLVAEVKRCFDIITSDKNKYAQLSKSCIEFAQKELSIEKFETSWVDAIETIRRK